MDIITLLAAHWYTPLALLIVAVVGAVPAMVVAETIVWLVDVRRR